VQRAVIWQCSQYVREVQWKAARDISKNNYFIVYIYVCAGHSLELVGKTTIKCCSAAVLPPHLNTFFSLYTMQGSNENTVWSYF
jgi:hypothetical protein